MEKVYILGDMLKKGSILLREQEAKKLRELGFDVYSAIEQKDINDKSNQTVESNNTLAERIVKKDSDAIRKASLIIAEVDNNNVGSSVEIGQIMEFNWFRDKIDSILTFSGDKNLRSNLEEFLKQYPRKFVYCHTTDIRHTDLEEKGMRRSFSINQYLHGACLELNKMGILTFDEIIAYIRRGMLDYIKDSAFEFDGLEIDDDYFKDKTNEEIAEMCDRYDYLWSK